FKRFRRAREERADHVAHVHEGAPGTHARALEHLHEANRIPAVLGHRSATHPDLYDRMVAADAAPSYARPLPPARLPTALGVLGGTAVAMVAFFALVFVTGVERGRRGDPLWHIALYGGDAKDLHHLAVARWDDGRHVDAIAFHRAAAALARGSV